MERAVLNLKSGASHECSLADPGSLQLLLARLVDPTMPGPPTLRLNLSQGAAIDVAIRNVASVELPAHFCVVRDFLAPQEMDAILAHALAHEDTFGDATVSSLASQGASRPDYRVRRSQISDFIAPLAPILTPRIRALMPRIWPNLRLVPIAIKKIEFELARHGDGGFFRTHTDRGLPDIAHRRVSCVYYFHREPRQFSGGHLRMYGTLIENGIRSCGTRFADIDPPRNGLIVFSSDCYHEVTPIQCASSAIADQRLSLNIWLCS